MDLAAFRTGVPSTPTSDREAAVLDFIQRLMATTDHLKASLRLQEGVTDDLRCELTAERARCAALQNELASARRDSRPIATGYIVPEAMAYGADLADPEMRAFFGGS